MTFGLVIASFSLPEWQAVKMTFFAHYPRLAYMHSVDHRILSLQPSLFYFAGLSLRAGGRGFSPATKRVAPGYFYWKIVEK